MALTVTAGDLEALRFCESDEARSIVQNIAVILTTAKGTAPGDREFGVDMSFLDLPLPVAKVRMIAAVREAVETFEPRVRVTGVTFDQRGEAEGRLVPRVEVEPA